jgi:hypothetical protein
LHYFLNTILSRIVRLGFASMSRTVFPLLPSPDGFGEPAHVIRRGVLRLLHGCGFTAVAELPLGSGRRADLAALGPGAEIWIVEIKSSVADYRADRKWRVYRTHCDRLLFAVAPDFPIECLPPDAGLIVADPYGGELVYQGALHRLSAATRKAMLMRIARTAASRLAALNDPSLPDPDLR